MSATPLGIILRAALIAGVVAGLVTAVFHSIVTEPVIEAAIALEEQQHTAPPHNAHEEPVVSRGVQRAGLFLGFALYGLTWALLVGAAAALAGRLLPGVGAPQQGMLLAALAWWSVTLLPFLKYPANPPGVGDPETITFRQSILLAFMALSVAGTALALALDRILRERRGGRLAAAGALVAFGALLYIAMPENPDAMTMPPALVTAFRVRSLAGLTLFWAVFGGMFGLALRRAPSPQGKPALGDASA